MSTKNIILTGFMGTGKTIVGQKVAEILKRDFYDSDRVICDNQNMSVAEIFARFGEDYFRSIETGVIRMLHEKSNIVIATGGGTLLNEENRNLLEKTGIIFYLYAGIGVIKSRLADTNDRPLITKPDADRRIVDLLEKRKDIYDSLPNRIDTSQATPVELAGKVIEIYNKSNQSRDES